MDNLPDTVLGWWVIVSDGNLARPSSVNSAATELDSLGASLLDIGRSTGGVVWVLARIVATIGEEWCIVKAGSSEWSWADHEDMGVCEVEEAEGGGDAGGETHFEVFQIRAGRSRDTGICEFIEAVK